MNNLEEKKELIVQSFSRTFDKEMAYTKVGLTEDEKEFLRMDSKFQERLDYKLITEREKLVDSLKGFTDPVDEKKGFKAIDEKIRFKATMELLHVLYPTFFSRPEDPNKSKGAKTNTEEENDRISNEYGHILGERPWERNKQ